MGDVLMKPEGWPCRSLVLNATSLRLYYSTFDE
jgi:hypothetical protein